MTDFTPGGPDETMPPIAIEDEIEIRDKEPTRRPVGRPKKATTSTNVRVNIGRTNTPKSKASPAVSVSEKDIAAVEKLAQNAAEFVVIGLAMAGQTTDAAIINKQKDQWAEAVSALAPYEDWLVNIAKGGEVSGRFMAWVGVGAASLAMVAPILLNHNALPPKIAAMVEQNIRLAAAANAGE